LGGIQRKIIDLVHHLENDKRYQDITPHIVVRRTETFNFESDLPVDFNLLHIQNKLHNKGSNISYSFSIYLTLEYKPKILVPFCITPQPIVY